MLEVSRVLAENRQLQIINLSWNFFTEHFSMTDYLKGIDELAFEEDQKFVSKKDKLIY